LKTAIKLGVYGLADRLARGRRGHLPNYLNEFQFRWNTRKMNDGQRVSSAVKAIVGKRLEYRESVENPPYLPKQAQQELEHLDAPFSCYSSHQYGRPH
jgi:hypothetical protein